MKSVDVSSVDVSLEEEELAGLKERLEALKSLGLTNEDIAQILRTTGLSSRDLTTRLLRASIPRGPLQITLAALVGTATILATTGAVATSSVVGAVAAPVFGVASVASICCFNNDPAAADEAFLRGQDLGKGLGKEF